MLLLLQVLTIMTNFQTGESFVHPSKTTDVMRTLIFPPHQQEQHSYKEEKQSPRRHTSLPFHSSDYHHDEQDPDEMRREIEAMRQEALQKLHVLQERMQEVQVVEQHDKVAVVAASEEGNGERSFAITSVADALDSSSSSSLAQSGEEVLLDFMEREKAALEETNSNLSYDDTDTTILQNEEKEQAAKQYSQAESLQRLNDTRWRMMLNIGRERGTWMPDEWGASGERLYLQLELEFSSSPLSDEGDDFLNGHSHTKVLRVVHNEASLSPTLTEGSRKVRVRNGAWRVAPYEGPMGTTVLRFYVELEEQTSHQDSDVWCPAGRVYCTCGYFPMYHDPVTGLVSTGSVPSSISTSSHIAPVSLKDALQEEQSQIASQYEALARANNEDPAILSWDKLKRSSKMMKLKQQATKLAHKRHELNIKEPDKSVLRLSQDQIVGLTRHGGVCCKVHKGLAIEYHMLGKFEIASTKNRDHSDYRELLP